MAGRSYYLETLHKESGGGDNLAVAWKGPAPFNTTNVIAAAYLKQPFSGFSAPRFNADPFTEAAAVVSSPYSNTLVDNVTDTNASETLLFTRLAGPAWLSVAPNGTLAGAPGPGDLGTNSFTVRVTDSAGFADEATMRVVVAIPAPPAILPGYSVGGGNFSLQFTGTVGQHYRVEYTPTLPAPGPWQVLTDIVSLSASPFTVSHPVTNSQGYYRVGFVP